MNRTHGAFTLIEVLACVLIVSLGLTAAAGLMIYGLRLMRVSHGKTIGMATAMTMIADPTPLKTDPTLSPSAPTTTGYLNGMWVIRTESREEPLEGAAGKLFAVTVTVDVYETTGGECFASVTRRMIREKP
jgi:prepilin-type N-terminal cleavage/methylation domain-containing protein